MLPLNLGKGKIDSAFLKVFEDKSLEQAKALLKDAWEIEDDSVIKAEIERRLKLLEPKGVNQTKCSSCGKLFQLKADKKVQEKFLPRMHKEKVWKPSIVIVGIFTFIPAPGSPTNLLGYSSVDPFAPISVILLWVIAGAVYWFGKRKEKKPHFGI